MSEKTPPWEQEEVRQATFNPGAKPPWEDDGSGPATIQEMHPDFGIGERLLLKNFANSPESSAAYLKKKHPGMDITIHNGQILGRNPGESHYRTLDPNPSLINAPLQFAKDLPLDVADVGTDVGQGIASTLATGAAGAAGGAATLPTGGWGALPAAITAGATTNAALEAGKQKLGQYFGIPQEVSGKQVAMAGAAGAASPLLFGTGATAAQLAKPGLTPEKLALLRGAQRGGVSRAWDFTKNTALPKAGEYLSGVPAEVIKERATNPAKLQAIQNEGLTEYLDDVHQSVTQGLAARKAEVGKKLEQEIAGAGKTVNLSQTKKIIDDHIKALENSELKNNPLVKQQLAELKSVRDDMLTEVTETVTKEPVMASSKLLDASGKPTTYQTGTRDVVQKNASELADEVSAQKAFELQELLKDQAELTKMNQGTTSRFAKGATSGEKQWAEANRRAYGQINKELDTATEGMSSELKKQYREYAQLQQDLKTRFATPEKTYQTLSGLHTKGKQVLKERLERISKLTGGTANPVEEAKTLAAYKTFIEHPATTPVSSGGATSTTRTLGLKGIGAVLGAKAAPIMGVSPTVGAATGAYFGNYMGSPSAINKYINAGKMIQSMGRPLTQGPAPVYPASGLSIWEMMQSQQPMENLYEQRPTY